MVTAALDLTDAIGSDEPTTGGGILGIWVSKNFNGRRNLMHGLSTKTWGFPRWHPDYGRDFRWVLFAFEHSGGGPRVPAEDWQTGTVNVMLCELNAPLYNATAPFWPDEVAADRVIYGHRLGITPVAGRSGLSTASSGPFGPIITEGLRTAGVQNRGVFIRADLAPLFDALGITLDGDHANLSATPGAVTPDVPHVRNPRNGGRARSSDPQWNGAVEAHAMRMAEDHMRSRGWDDVETLGKPYDLCCRRGAGEQKHVEVKGASGSGANVEFTPNEVEHFRNCPHGADLIVVRDIAVDTSTAPYGTSGGTLLHIENYRAPATDLQATGWTARVPGWGTLGVQEASGAGSGTN